MQNEQIENNSGSIQDLYSKIAQLEETIQRLTQDVRMIEFNRRNNR